MLNILFVNHCACSIFGVICLKKGGIGYLLWGAVGRGDSTVFFCKSGHHSYQHQWDCTQHVLDGLNNKKQTVAICKRNEIVTALTPLLCLLPCRVGHGHLLPALWEAFPDPDGTAAAHGGPRRRPQLHLQRMQPDFPQPYCTQTSPALTHRSVEALT